MIQRPRSPHVGEVKDYSYLKIENFLIKSAFISLQSLPNYTLSFTYTLINSINSFSLMLVKVTYWLKS